MIRRWTDKISAVVPSKWNFLSLVILIVVLMLGISNWPRMPYFLDCYYHLSVVRGFSQAGGWVGEAFWEFAPFGRPHLYPPFYHIIGLLFFKCGMGLIGIARLFDSLIFPLFLLTIWKTMREFYGSRSAFFCLFLFSSSFAFYLSIVNNIPFSLAFIFNILSFYSLKKSRYVSSCLFLILSFYTHTLMPWLFIIFLLFVVLTEPELRVPVTRLICLSIIAALPFIIHELRHVDFYRFIRLKEFYFAEIEPITYILAVYGFMFALKKRGEYLYPLWLLLAFIPLFLVYRNRFISGLGFMPLIIFAAMALDCVWEFVSFKKNKRTLYRIIFFLSIFFIFYLFNPVITFLPNKKIPEISAKKGAVLEFLNDQDKYCAKNRTLYYPKLVKEVVAAIEENTKEDDIIFSNFRYAGGMVSSLSGRATSNGMLAEVVPFRKGDEISRSKLIIFFKDPDKVLPIDMNQLVSVHSLRYIGETKLAYLFVNDKSVYKREIVSARVPFFVSFGLIVLIFFIIWLDTSGRLSFAGTKTSKI